MKIGSLGNAAEVQVMTSLGRGGKGEEVGKPQQQPLIPLKQTSSCLVQAPREVKV